MFECELGRLPFAFLCLGFADCSEVLPDRWDGHNKLVFEPPWNVTIRGDFACVYHTPKPPSCPPPAHVLNQGSANKSSSDPRPLPSLNASSGPTRPLPKPAPSSTSSSSNRAPVIDLSDELRPAVVHGNSSRFAAAPPNSNQSTMGRVIPLTKNDWNALVNKEMLAFATPYPSVRA